MTPSKIRGLFGALLVVGVVLSNVPANAADLPPAGSAYQVQTNGPNGAIGLGDWYTSAAAGGGAGHHYVIATVPCGWPSTEPVNVDLFSPEMNAVAGALGLSEEPNGAYDSTQFELYGPGASVGPGFGQPAPGTGIGGARVTYQPGAPGVPEAWVRFATLPAPVACGSYVVRSEVLAADPLNPAGLGNDQNSWRIRVGRDDDGDPTNPPPANVDDFDLAPGTNDEIAIGAAQVSYQHESGAVVCATYYQYVSPGQASVTFNNFDMDGNNRLRYYAPSDVFDPTATVGGTVGTISGNAAWNGGTTAARGGDTIANPEPGWWRLVPCVSGHNQLHMEGQTGVPVFYTQPSTPSLGVAIDDGVATISPGQSLTYTIDLANAVTATPGVANAVLATVPLPAGVTFTGCSVADPADGTWTCSEAGGVVTYTQTGWVDAGDGAQLTMTVDVAQGAAGPITMPVSATYSDQLGNPFGPVSASDVDALGALADLSITIDDSADPVLPGDTFSYTVVARNDGPSDASGLQTTVTVPAPFTATSASSPAGTCSVLANVVTCTRPALAVGGQWTITVDASVDPSAVPGTFSAPATVASNETDADPADNTDAEDTTVGAAWADLSISITDSADPVSPNQAFSYELVVSNAGPSDATVVNVSATIPAGFTVTGVSSASGTCSFVGGAVTCSLPALSTGATWSITVAATVDAATAPGVYTATASVTGAEPDPDLANNADTEDTTVSGDDAVPPGDGDGDGVLADIVVEVTVDFPEVPESAVVKFDVTVRNDGPDDATNVVVSDSLPKGLELWASDPDAGEYDDKSGDWFVGDLAVGQEQILTLVVTTADGTAGSSITNHARVTERDQADPQPENDADEAMVQVLGVTLVSADDPDALAYTGAGAPVVGLIALALSLGTGGILALILAGIRRREEDETTA